MDPDRIFENIIDAYAGYYDIKREGAASPFDAEAFLSNEAEQYFLVKAAKVASVNSYEYVFFIRKDDLRPEELIELDKRAWEEGMSRVKPDGDHKNTDVSLIVVTQKAAGDIPQVIKSLNHSRNYKFGLLGFSNYRLVVIEAGAQTVHTNRRGRELKDFVQRAIQR